MRSQIRERIAATYDVILAETRRNQHEFVWNAIASVGASASRSVASRRRLDDGKWRSCKGFELAEGTESRRQDGSLLAQATRPRSRRSAAGFSSACFTRACVSRYVLSRLPRAVSNWSLWMDLFILMKTLWIVASGSGI